MLIENLSADWRTPAALAEQAEAAAGPQSATQAKQPGRAALLAEAEALLAQASPALREAVAHFVKTEILLNSAGRVRRASDVGARFATLCYAVEPGAFSCMAEVARGLGISKTMASRHGLRLIADHGFTFPRAPRPGNEDGPRGAAKANQERRLDRRRVLERQADELLTAAGVAPRKTNAPTAARE